MNPFNKQPENTKAISIDQILTASYDEYVRNRAKDLGYEPVYDFVGVQGNPRQLFVPEATEVVVGAQYQYACVKEIGFASEFHYVMGTALVRREQPPRRD